MTEEQVFLAALDLPDAAARAAHLDESCGDDAELRRQVEALLAAHFRSGEFLDVPAVEQVEAGSRDENTVAISEAAVSAEQDREDESDGLPFLTPSIRPDSLGRLGHYEMLQVLGRGGFGIVFRAFDDMLQRVVALKVMAPQIATLSPARRRFVREAQSSAQVRHEHVVQVHEVGEQPLPYLVMEFIPGETLQQKLDRCGPLDVSEVVRIGRQVAEGLAAAHACDLIHRDIKPGNILLEGGSHKAKITDFGLARAADDASISQSGIIAGTPMFMAPEQALGHKIDQRADLFSLGSVLYQMASGRPPFRAPSALAVLKRVAEEPPRSIHEIIPETPDWLCGIIAKLHAKNPDERFQSAREVADLLADCDLKLKAKQKVKNVLPAARKPAGRKWVAAAAVLLLPVIALVVTEFAGVTQLFQEQQVRPGPISFGGEPNLVAKNDPLPQLDGRVQLFNGKDTTGWVVKHRMWQVKDGAIVAIPEEPVGKMGAKSKIMHTVKNFREFDLSFQVRLKDGLGRVGVNFRALVPQGPKELLGGRWMFHRGGANLVVVTDDEATPLESPPKAMRPDDFNDITIRCVGKKVTVTVNGNVNFDEKLDNLADEGVIGWRIGPGVTEATFRNIRLIDLGSQPTPVVDAKKETLTDADVKRIVALPAAEQVEEVRKELMRRNAGFDGKIEHKFEGGVVTEFRIVTDKVTDIFPIRVFNALRVFDCSGTSTKGKPNGQLADLPQEGMNLAGLTHLNLSNTRVSDAGLAHFKGCKNLVALRLHNTQVGDAGLAHFEDCKNLSVLNLTDTKVSDKGLAHFKGCKNLVGLYLSGTKMSDAGLAHFEDCKGLVHLNLSGTQVSDAGLAYLKDCKNITGLDLAVTKVSDAGLEHLKGMPLKQLFIAATDVTDLRPLRGMALEDVRLTPRNIAQGLDVLRDLKSLKTVGIDSGQSWPAAEFWEHYDKGEFTK